MKRNVQVVFMLNNSGYNCQFVKIRAIFLLRYEETYFYYPLPEMLEYN